MASGKQIHRACKPIFVGVLTTRSLRFRVHFRAADFRKRPSGSTTAIVQIYLAWGCSADVLWLYLKPIGVPVFRDVKTMQDAYHVPIPRGPKYPNTRNLPKTIITIPDIETIDTLYFGNLDPLGMLCLPKRCKPQV